MKAVERGVGGVLAGAASLELYTFAPRGVRRVMVNELRVSETS
jgi:hypothetical protein